MAVKVNVGFSRKVGEPNYSSRGASVELQLELDGTCLNDPEQFHLQIDGIFEQARDAVDRELEREASAVAKSQQFPDRAPEHTGQNGHRRATRLATPNQARAIEAIVRNRGADLSQILAARFDGKATNELTIVEASLLIDCLKSLPTRDFSESSNDA